MLFQDKHLAFLTIFRFGAEPVFSGISTLKTACCPISVRKLRDCVMYHCGIFYNGGSYLFNCTVNNLRRDLGFNNSRFGYGGFTVFNGCDAGSFRLCFTRGSGCGRNTVLFACSLLGCHNRNTTLL